MNGKRREIITRGGGVLKKVLYGEAPPRGPTPYPFICHFFRKGTPFVYHLKVPFRAEPPRIGHYREYPPGNYYSHKVEENSGRTTLNR